MTIRSFIGISSLVHQFLDVSRYFDGIVIGVIPPHRLTTLSVNQELLKVPLKIALVLRVPKQELLICKSGLS